MFSEDKLLEHLRDEMLTLDGVVEKKMFGGHGFMWHGNMLCAASSRGLLVRVGEEAAQDLLHEEGASLMVMNGRTLKAWMRVEPEAIARKPAVRHWFKHALAFAETLPEK